MSNAITYCGHPDYAPNTVVCDWVRSDPDLPLKCSMCGSISGDDFLRVAEQGMLVIPTDKSYKAYVMYDTGLPEAREIQKEGNLTRHLRTGGVQQVKFYYGHFDENQRRRFVDLYNLAVSTRNKEGMKIGHPGHFYVLPFFMKLGD